MAQSGHTALNVHPKFLQEHQRPPVHEMGGVSAYLPAYPGFIVMKTPNPGLTMMSLPIKEILGFPLLRACWMVMTCWPTTDKTCVCVHVGWLRACDFPRLRLGAISKCDGSARTPEPTADCLK